MPTMSSSPSDDRFERFRVEPWGDWFGGFVARRPRLWRRIGDLETRQFGRVLDSIAIRAQPFVCGLARSGRSILLERRSEESRVGKERGSSGRSRGSTHSHKKKTYKQRTQRNYKE